MFGILYARCTLSSLSTRQKTCTCTQYSSHLPRPAAPHAHAPSLGRGPYGRESACVCVSICVSVCKIMSWRESSMGQRVRRISHWSYRGRAPNGLPAHPDPVHMLGPVRMCQRKRCLGKGEGETERARKTQPANTSALGHLGCLSWRSPPLRDTARGLPAGQARAGSRTGKVMSFEGEIGWPGASVHSYCTAVLGIGALARWLCGCFMQCTGAECQWRRFR